MTGAQLGWAASPVGTQGNRLRFVVSLLQSLCNKFAGLHSAFRVCGRRCYIFQGW